MNILFLSTTYPTPLRPRQGTFNRSLVDALRVKHDVRVIAPIPWTQRIFGNHTRRNQGDRQRSGDGSENELYPTYLYTPKLLRRHYGLFYWRSIQPALRHLEKSFRPELVIGYWLHPDGAAALRAAQRYEVPCLAFSGGSDLRLLPNNRKRRIEIERTLTHADRLIVVSHELAERAQKLGMPADRTDVIYRGVDHHCFYPSDQIQARDHCKVDRDAIVVFWAGRFEPVKNPTMLFHAAVAWRKRWGKRLRVLIAGDGSMRRQLRKLRTELELTECVRFEGNLCQHELALRYNAANVTVLTSHSEGIPNVLLESIACGVPFVATDVGGISEIATEGIDRLVAADEIDEFAEATMQIIGQPSGSLANTSRIFVPDGLSGMAGRFESVFDRLSARSGITR